MLAYITLSIIWFYSEITQNNGEVLVLQMADIMTVVIGNGTPSIMLKGEAIP